MWKHAFSWMKTCERKKTVYNLIKNTPFKELNMKKAKIILLLIAGAMMFFQSCTEDQAQAPAPVPMSADTGESQAATESSASGEVSSNGLQFLEAPAMQSVNAISGLFLYELSKDENGNQVFTQDGGNLPLFSRPNTINLEMEEVYRSTGKMLYGRREGYNYNSYLVEVVKENGETAWTLRNYFAEDGVLGVVVKENALLFSLPDPLYPSTTLVNSKTILGVARADEMSQGTDFYRVYGLDDWIGYGSGKESEQWISNLYIKKSDISLREDDVKSIIFFYRIRNASLTQQNLIRGQFTNVERLHKTSVFMDFIESQKSRYITSE
jgi:hypothetical protein